MEMIRDCLRPEQLDAMRKFLEGKSDIQTPSELGDQLRRKRDEEAERRDRETFYSRRAKAGVK